MGAKNILQMVGIRFEFLAMAIIDFFESCFLNYTYVAIHDGSDKSDYCERCGIVGQTGSLTDVFFLFLNNLRLYLRFTYL